MSVFTNTIVFDQRMQLDFLEKQSKCVESFLELQEIHVELFIPTLKPENQPEFIYDKGDLENNKISKTCSYSPNHLYRK